MNATALAVQCLQLALAATDDDDLPRLFAGPSGQAALANHSWSYVADDGSIDGWVLSESFQPGSSGGVGHDGSDLFANLVGTQHVLDFVDIEITEAWYPMQVVEKRAAPGPHGAGRHRSGSGCRMSYRVTGDRRLTGAMFAMRETLPVGGVAGGEPGAPTEFRIRRADGSAETLAAHQAGVVLEPGDVFEFEAGSGGGYGDPLGRDAEAVRRDVVVGRLSSEDALTTYGVVLDGDGVLDPAATTDARADARRRRLAGARPPVRPPDPVLAPPDGGPPQPLYHGVVQRGNVAIALGSGAVLAVAPDQWSDGCAVIEESRASPTGAVWTRRTYLDPISGAALFVEAVPEGAGRSFSSAPRRWTDTSAAQAV
jgi:N-methylhydantoinase B